MQLFVLMMESLTPFYFCPRNLEMLKRQVNSVRSPPIPPNPKPDPRILDITAMTGIEVEITPVNLILRRIFTGEVNRNSRKNSHSQSRKLGIIQQLTDLKQKISSWDNVVPSLKQNLAKVCDNFKAEGIFQNIFPNGKR